MTEIESCIRRFARDVRTAKLQARTAAVGGPVQYISKLAGAPTAVLDLLEEIADEMVTALRNGAEKP